MDEKLVTEMEKEVGRADPEFEAQWAKAALDQQKAEEKVLQSAWRMWKYVRNDERMREVKKNLDQARSCIEYLEGVLRDLGRDSD